MDISFEVNTICPIFSQEICLLACWGKGGRAYSWEGEPLWEIVDIARIKSMRWSPYSNLIYAVCADTLDTYIYSKTGQMLDVFPWETVSVSPCGEGLMYRSRKKRGVFLSEKGDAESEIEMPVQGEILSALYLGKRVIASDQKGNIVSVDNSMLEGAQRVERKGWRNVDNLFEDGAGRLLGIAYDWRGQPNAALVRVDFATNRLDELQVLEGWNYAIAITDFGSHAVRGTLDLPGGFELVELK